MKSPKEDVIKYIEENIETYVAEALEIKDDFDEGKFQVGMPMHPLTHARAYTTFHAAFGLSCSSYLSPEWFPMGGLPIPSDNVRAGRGRLPNKVSTTYAGYPGFWLESRAQAKRDEEISDPLLYAMRCFYQAAAEGWIEPETGAWTNYLEEIGVPALVKTEDGEIENPTISVYRESEHMFGGLAENSIPSARSVSDVAAQQAKEMIDAASTIAREFRSARWAAMLEWMGEPEVDIAEYNRYVRAVKSRFEAYLTSGDPASQSQDEWDGLWRTVEAYIASLMKTHLIASTQHALIWDQTALRRTALVMDNIFSYDIFGKAIAIATRSVLRDALTEAIVVSGRQEESGALLDRVLAVLEVADSIVIARSELHRQFLTLPADASDQVIIDGFDELAGKLLSIQADLAPGLEPGMRLLAGLWDDEDEAELAEVDSEIPDEPAGYGPPQGPAFDVNIALLDHGY